VRQFQQSGQIPASLAAAGLPESGRGGSRFALNADGMVLTVSTKAGELVFTPKQNQGGSIHWECHGSAEAAALPKGCEADAAFKP
jgi:uncharacterized FlgJ-related protein